MAKKSIRILGLDPGKTNFGISVTEFNAAGTSYKPLYAGKLKNTITDMSQLVAHMDHFNDELGLLLEYKPQLVVIERFMNRGSFSGDQGEYVGCMLSLAAYQARANCGSAIQIVQPGVWKQAFNRVLGWKAKDPKPTPLDKLYKYCLTESHELDAFLMTHFGHSLLTGTPYFSLIRSKPKSVFLAEFEAVATGKKKRKRL